MAVMNRIIGALKGAADPGRTSGHGGRTPGAPVGRRPGSGGGLAGIVGSVLGGLGRRPRR